MSGPPGVTDPRPAQVTPSSEASGGLLRPNALPSDTAVRFVLLILTVSAASLYLFQALWFVLRGRLFADAVQRCGTEVTEVADGMTGTVAAELQRMTACRGDVSLEQAAFAVGGSLLVLGAAWVAYRFLPDIRERRRHLDPADPDDSQALLDEVAALSAEAGLARPPAVRLDAANPGVQAYVYGAGNNLRLAMTGGLVVQQVLDPQAFRAVLRHELAHVANRDVPWTYYTVAVWWSFVALALIPIAIVFVFNDLKYVLQLGWRTALLALLVALVAAAVLRAREAYADARSVQWGPAADLDLVLAAQPAASGRRPAQLRLHPSAQERRLLLADPDRLFQADWFTALAAGVAGGTALASLQSIAYLSLPSVATVLAVFLVAPLLAAVICVPSWRVGLREAARGVRQPLGLPLGIGLAVGLSVAPLLTFDAARGGVASGLDGWSGYLLWVLGMSVATVLVMRWVADSARVRVAARIPFASPRRALVGHIVAASVVMAALLACGYYARLLLTSVGPQALADAAPWLALPAMAFGSWFHLAPILVVAAVVAVPWLARRDLGRAVPVPAAWPWSVPPSRTTGAIESLPASRPLLAPIVAIGLAAGGTAAIAILVMRLLVQLLPSELRGTDALTVAVGSAIEGSVLAAMLVASVASAFVLSARWWPLALLAAALAGVLTGVSAILIQLLANCGVLPSVAVDCSLPRWGLVAAALVDPVIRAAPLAFLLAASIGLVRSYRHRIDPVLRGSDTGRVARRTLVAAVSTVVAVGIWAGSGSVRMFSVEPTRVTGPEYEIVLPGLWNGQLNSQTGETVFETLAQDVRVVIQPIVAPARPATGEWVNVGGRRAFFIGGEQQGGVRIVAYDVRGPDDAYRIVVVGTPASLEQRQAELTALFGAVSWRDT